MTPQHFDVIVSTLKRIDQADINWAREAEQRPELSSDEQERYARILKQSDGLFAVISEFTGTPSKVLQEIFGFINLELIKAKNEQAFLKHFAEVAESVAAKYQNGFDRCPVIIMNESRDGSRLVLSGSDCIDAALAVGINPDHLNVQTAVAMEGAPDLSEQSIKNLKQELDAIRGQHPEHEREVTPNENP
jgi:hypothetical protein